MTRRRTHSSLVEKSGSISRILPPNCFEKTHSSGFCCRESPLPIKLSDTILLSFGFLMILMAFGPKVLSLKFLSLKRSSLDTRFLCLVLEDRPGFGRFSASDNGFRGSCFGLAITSTTSTGGVGIVASSLRDSLLCALSFLVSFWRCIRLASLFARFLALLSCLVSLSSGASSVAPMCDC